MAKVAYWVQRYANTELADMWTEELACTPFCFPALAELLLFSIWLLVKGAVVSPADSNLADELGNGSQHSENKNEGLLLIESFGRCCGRSSRTKASKQLLLRL